MAFVPVYSNLSESGLYFAISVDAVGNFSLGTISRPAIGGVPVLCSLSGPGIGLQLNLDTVAATSSWSIIGIFQSKAGAVPLYGYAAGAITAIIIDPVANTVTAGAFSTTIDALLGGSSGRQPTYYFSAAGSDANDGRTISTPKQTISAFNGLTLVATDYVAFRQGDTFAGTMTIPGGGSTLSTVIIGSYGIGAAPIIAAAASTDGIDATNLSYLTVQNLTVTGAGGTSGDGIKFLNSSGNANNLSIINCTVSGFAGNGINILASSGVITGVNLTNCTSFNNTAGVSATTAGIRVGGVYGAQVSGVYGIKNATISGCVTHDNPGKSGLTNWSGSGIFLAQCDNTALKSNGGIINCTSYTNGANSNTTSGPAGTWTADSKWVFIQLCESYDMRTATNDGAGFDMDGGCDNCTIQYCFSHGNFGGGFFSFAYDDAGKITGNTNNIIRFNISVGDGLASTGSNQGGITLVSGFGSSANTGLQVYGNTIYGTSTSSSAAACIFCVRNGTPALSGTIANNIFFAARSNLKLIDTLSTNPSGLTFVGNCYYGASTFTISWNSTTYTSYAAWQTATGQEKIAGTNVGFNVHPALYLVGSNTSSDYRITDQSTLLNAGVDLFANYSIDPGTRDFFGGAVSSSGPWSVGASWAGSKLNIVYLTTTGGVQTQTIPADFVSLYSVETIAGGAGSNAGASGAGGGGGGAYAKILSTSTALAANSNISYGVGIGGAAASGGDTFWNAISLADAVSKGSAISCAAQHGTTNSGATGGAGGATAASVGTTTFKGGSGGTYSGTYAGGGGGSGGPLGAGGNGAAGGGAPAAAGGGGGNGGGANAVVPTTTTGGAGGGNILASGGGVGTLTVGGNGARGGGGAGAGASAGAGGAGSTGIEWDATHGSGGGGGGEVTGGTAGGLGGFPGGGAGARRDPAGGAGEIRFAYKTAGVI